MVLLIFVFYNFKSLSAVNTKIIAKVGTNIITSYELENKIKTILFLSKKEITQENINQVNKRALRELVNMKLKNDEIAKYKININDERVDSHINNIFYEQQLNKKELQKMMTENDISFNLYYEDMRTNLSWQNLIYELNKEKLNIDEIQILRELNEIVSKKRNIVEYELAEITIDTLNNFQKQNEIIKEIKDYIAKNNFEEAAIKYSNSSSSLNSGNIGWIKYNTLSKNLKNILNKMNVGEISEPINDMNQIMFVKILDKRFIKINVKEEAEKIKQLLINQRKNELLNMHSNNHLSQKKNNTIINFFNE